MVNIPCYIWYKYYFIFTPFVKNYGDNKVVSCKCLNVYTSMAFLKKNLYTVIAIN